MSVLLKSVRSAYDKLKSKIYIASVPHELEEQFDQLQLKNSLHRLKIFALVTVVFNALNWPVYILRADEISSAMFHKMFFSDLGQLLITLVFLLCANCFSKKNKTSALWYTCYCFVILNYIVSAYAAEYTKIFIVLQIFITYAYLHIFIPDFKPRIFISFLALWYLSLSIIIADTDKTFIVGGPQVFALNIFLIALIIKILHYNSTVKTFINTFRIAALNEKLEALSITDELTKLHNRRSFLEYMGIIWKQSRSLRIPLSVLMIDVDYFKKYNDCMGHLEGDKVLIAVAQCMKSRLKRDTDFIARFGGEEFVCLLPYIEKEAAADFAKELVQCVEGMKIPHPMSDISKYVTISVGMANIMPGDHNSQTQALDEADKALYTAKHSGRNRVAAS